MKCVWSIGRCFTRADTLDTTNNFIGQKLNGTDDCLKILNREIRNNIFVTCH